MKEKMSNYKKWTWIITGICVIVAMFGLVVLPDIIPIHFGPSGEPDDWGSKFNILLYPGIVVLVNASEGFVKKLDPKYKNYEYFNKYYEIFFIGFSAFFSVIEVANIAIGLGASINVGSIICFVMGIFMIFVGNMLPKIKQNHSFGIKLPWTVTDEDNWYKTHRLGGKCFFIGGIMMMVCVFLPGEGKIVGLVAITLVMAVIPSIYSGMIYYKKHRKL